MKKLNQHLFYFLVALNGVDAGITAAPAILIGPQIEANPIMRALIHVHPLFFIAVKLLMVHSIALVAPKVDGSRSFTPLLSFLSGSYVLLVVRNALIMAGHWPWF